MTQKTREFCLLCLFDAALVLGSAFLVFSILRYFNL